MCITNAYYKGADGIIIVFDKSNRVFIVLFLVISLKNSYDGVDIWLSQVKEYVDKDPLYLLLGNKSDLSMEEI